MDGFSRNLVWRRLEQAYAALAAQQPLPPAEFEPLRERFAHEQKYYRSASFDEDRRFFAALLKERPPQVTLSRKPPAATRKFHRSTTYLPGPTTQRCARPSPVQASRAHSWQRRRCFSAASWVATIS